MSGSTDMEDVGEDALRQRLEAQEREIARRDRELGLLTKRIHDVEGEDGPGTARGPVAARLALREHQVKRLQQFQGLRHLIGRGPVKAEAEQVRQSRFFDADWYLETYPDVAAAGLDPAHHYASSGHYEGRSPGPTLDTLQYVQDHPDAGGSATQLLAHKERSGARG